MIRKYLHAFAVLLTVAAGCGDDTEVTGESLAFKAQQCDGFVSTLCRSVALCNQEKSGKPNPPTFMGNCVDSWYSQRDCNDYAAPTETHDTCIQQLRGFSCDVLVGGSALNLPAACGKVVDSWR